MDSDEALLEELHDRIYRKFIEPFDAVDNGVNQYPSDIEPAYVRPYDIFAQIEDLNPSWNEETSINPDARFLDAVELARKAFDSYLGKTLNSWLPARSIVQTGLLKVPVSAEGEHEAMLILESNCPWKEHLFDLEEKLGVNGRILYVLYEDRNEMTWRIQCVPAKLDSFESRKSLPEAWRGLRDGELDAASGIVGGTFVHRSGFIGGNRTLAGAKAMALAAINQ